jgi:hypothetical protein
MNTHGFEDGAFIASPNSFLESSGVTSLVQVTIRQLRLFLSAGLELLFDAMSSGGF